MTSIAFFTRRRVRTIVQSEAGECGVACLAMLSSYHGAETNLPTLRRRFSGSLKGVTLSTLRTMSQDLGFEVRALRADLDYLRQAKEPCILHWGLNHFVVLGRVTKRWADIHDPARGTLRLSWHEVSNGFTGVVMEVTPGLAFVSRPLVSRVSIRSLAGGIGGLKRSMAQVVALAMGIEAMAMLLPFQAQVALDHMIPAADTSLVPFVFAAFLLVVLFQAVLSFARAWLLTWIGATLNVQWVSNLFAHLLKLPIDFFEKRHVGDVVSRFSSLHAIQATLTGSFVEAVLDGAISSLVIMVLCLYSVKLATCVLLGLFAYIALRAMCYRHLWALNEEQLVFEARQQTELLESIRGIQAIKLANKQGVRRMRLGNATMASAERAMRIQRMTQAFGGLSVAIFSTQRIAVIALGAWLAIKGGLTSGMLVAVLAYVDQVSSKLGGLVDKLVDLRILRLHLERITDIAEATPEETYTRAVGPQPPVNGRITLRGLGFRYADNEPWVLRNLDLTIEAGESVAIVGPSGCGKTTLGKLLVGLLVPTEGVIELDGIDIRHFGLDRYRAIIGSVMQDDSLFAGSIADNISFFDEDARLEDVVDAARVACLHDDIMATSMGYESLVGDMGSALSGGQRQRLIFARAIYRRPRILLLDEATSHLDTEREREINARVMEMKMTRIVIAHRHETIATADRIISLVQTHEGAARPVSMVSG